jgi:hypothetical protein
MRAFLIGCGAALVIAVASAVILQNIDLSSGSVYSSENVRLH